MKKETKIAILFGNFHKKSLTVSEQMSRFSLGLKAENNPELLSPKEMDQTLSLLEMMKLEGHGDPVLLREFGSFVNTVTTANQMIYGY